MHAYKFVSYARDEKPDTEITRLLERLAKGATLNRVEKDRTAEVCHNGTYRLGGWAWSMHTYLNQYGVEFTWGGLEYRYAPDKTSLRKILPSIKRIIDVQGR